jgi:hypothetical protein
MQTKKCSICKQNKSIMDFGKSSRNKDGYKGQCKKCRNEQKRIYNAAHPEIGHNYYITNILSIKEKKRIYDSKTIEQGNARKRKYVLNNPQKRKQQYKKYYNTHKIQIKEREYKKRELNNKKHIKYIHGYPQARIAHNLRSRIGHVLAGRQKGGHLSELVGCDMIFFKSHLESKFTVEMNWNNYGRGIGRWSMDHIIPLESYDLRNIEEQKKAFHYTNCAPMWYSENSSKSSWYNGKLHRKIKSK